MSRIFSLQRFAVTMNRVTDEQVRCESCGKVLENPDQICNDCDILLNQARREVMLYPVSDVKTKTFCKVCPSCGLWLSPKHMRRETYPRNARWYVYQEPCPVCPNCRTILASRHIPEGKYFLWAWLAIWSSDIIKWYMPPFGFLLWFAITAIILSIISITHYRDYKDEASFVVRK